MGLVGGNLQIAAHNTTSTNQSGNTDIVNIGVDDKQADRTITDHSKEEEEKIPEDQ